MWGEMRCDIFQTPDTMLSFARQCVPTLRARFFSTARVALQTAGEPETAAAPAAPARSVLRDSMAAVARDLAIAAELAHQEILPQLEPQFRVGETYDPWDFRLSQIRDRRLRLARAQHPGGDALKRAGINPRDLYALPEVLLRYLSATGKILPRNITGLHQKTQKQVARTVKQARVLGNLSKWHRHPLFLLARKQ